MTKLSILETRMT